MNTRSNFGTLVLQLLLSLFVCMQGMSVANAQTHAPQLSQTAPKTPVKDEEKPAVANSAMDGVMFYQVLQAELALRDARVGDAFKLYLDAARRTPDDALFERATRIALDARDGNTARQVSVEWAEKVPESAQAQNYLFQIQFELGQQAASMQPLRRYLQLSPDSARPGIISGLGRYFSRMSDRAAALIELERVLTPYFATPSPTSGAARLLLARQQIDQSQYVQALDQLQTLTRQQPQNIDGWLLLGVLQLQENQFTAAEQSLQNFLKLAAQMALPSNHGSYAQAYLALAQLAENRKDFDAAQRYLSKIEDEKERLAAQVRRASILAKQGALDKALALIEQLPEPTVQQARAKLLAQVHLLRDHKALPQAIALLDAALKVEPEDTDLMYELSTLHEKAKAFDRMEALLQKIIVLKPGNQTAYNALGYSLADRGVRLEEAKRLIEKALEITPNDPYITDSLGWVEFRMGKLDAALKTLQGAYKMRADAEIGAHIGEVLWRMNRQAEAKQIWREAQSINPDNETLLETLQRLGVKP